MSEEHPYDRAVAKIADEMSPRVQHLKSEDVSEYFTVQLVAHTFNVSIAQVIIDVIRLHKPHEPEPVTQVFFTHDQVALLLEVVTKRIETLDKTHQRSNSRTKFRLVDKVVQLREIVAKLT